MVEANKSPRSLEYAFAVARQVWSMARRDGLTDRVCPTGEVKKPRIDNKRMRFLTHQEADALLQNLKTRNQQLHGIALLALHCGLRAGEVFNLTWGDVDTGRDLIALRDTKSGNRMAYMTGEVKTMFMRLGSGDQNELVFKVRRKALLKKGEVRVKQVSNSFDRAVADVGFNKGVTDRRQRVVFHTLRHTLRHGWWRPVRTFTR